MWQPPCWEVYYCTGLFSQFLPSLCMYVHERAKLYEFLCAFFVFLCLCVRLCVCVCVCLGVYWRGCACLWRGVPKILIKSMRVVELMDTLGCSDDADNDDWVSSFLKNLRDYNASPKCVARHDTDLKYLLSSHHDNAAFSSSPLTIPPLRDDEDDHHSSVT